jgi:uncharacterized protein
MQHGGVPHEESLQARVVARLTEPGAYPHDVDEVVHVQTHISHVFLAGPFVYKLKKAVVFPFLDFGTVAARERCCREELRLNRRLAAPVYLDVLPITEDPDGLRLGGDGSPVDWVVRMRRLPADRGLGALLARGAVDDALVGRLGRHVAAFHATAPVATGGGPDALARAWRENLEGLAPMAGMLLAPEDLAILADFGPTWVARRDAILRARVDLGHVRDAHGDLRVDHVYVLEDALPARADAPAVPRGIWIVDCIEFSPAFRAVDVAADLSFLAMELESLGHARLAESLVAAYADAADDALVPALVPFHACHRAIVRGKVEGLTAGDAQIAPAGHDAAAARARALFGLAGRYAWRSGDPVVVACAGLSGTGKSAIAAALGEATGFRVAGSDVLRRQAAPSGAARYALAAREAVYALLREQVDAALTARESLILDATFLARAERDRLAHTVAGYGSRHVFVACEADDATVRRRLDARDATSVSDARWDTYVAQRRARDPFGDGEPVLRVDTGGTPSAARAALLPRLWRWRRHRTIGDG